MTGDEKRFTEPLEGKTYRDVMLHLKKRNKNMFRHITKAGMDFQDVIFVFKEKVPDT